MKVSNNCYFPLTPLDPAKVDASGHVKGSDLRGTDAYERFVDSLSRHSDASAQSSPMNREQARDAIDGMKIKAGTILVARCPDGQSDAHRVVPSSVVPSATAPASVASATVASSTVAQPEAAGALQSRGAVAASTGSWQCLVDHAKRFFASFGDQPTGTGNPQTALRENVRDYERHLNALVYASAM